MEAGIADRSIAPEQKSAERTRWRSQEVIAVVPVRGRPEMGVNVEDAADGGLHRACRVCHRWRGSEGV